jgi:oligopeptide transport system permease protein
MDGIAGYALRRLLLLPLTLLVVSVGTFYITRWGPGDPISTYSGVYRDEEAFERARANYGLDKPVHEQYVIWLRQVVTEGDFGPSFTFRDRDVTEIIFPKMWVSMRLGLYAFIIMFVVGIPAGVYAATRQGTWVDPAIIAFFLVFQSIPVLVVVPMLVLVLSVQLGWVPPGGFDGLFSRSMIIPTIALSLPGIAGVARLARAATLQTMNDDFVRTARAKGLDELTVVTRHVFRNSVLPLMTTVVGLSVVGLLEGAFFAEILLGIPGIGSFMYEAVRGRDYNVILAVVVIISTAFVLANLAVDLLLIWIDPRIRASGTVR